MPRHDDALYGRLQWLMFLRVVVATFLLGATILLQVRETKSLLALPLFGLNALIASTYLVTLIYVFLLRRIKNLEALAYGQIAVDLLLETALVYLTGLEDSVFSSIYNLSIITGSILLYRQGGLMTAAFSSLLYGALMNLRYFGVLPAGGWIPPELSGSIGIDIFYQILVNISAFFLVAFLSSYLAEQARISQDELKVIQSDLSELAAIHENILQCLQSGLLTVDLQGQVTFANQAAERITEVPVEKMIRSPLTSLFPHLTPASLDDLPLGSQGSENRRRTMDYQHPSGRISHLGFSLAQLRNADEARMGTILHFQDLTQTVALEEQLRRVDRLATVGEMAARIAHEIRNPLASLSGSIQILKDELSLDGPNSRLMGIVLRETQRLNTLLTDFLLFARPEKLQIQEMDLSSALQETLDLFIERGKDGPVIEILRDIVPDLVINADPKKMRQVFWNLFNNASEAMPQGGRLEVRAKWSPPTVKRTKTEDPEWVLMEVEDSGVGIGSEHLDRIFDPFFTTRDRGTGLGLSVVHRNIEDQGGRISVRSELGRGTRFTLWIPPNPPQSALAPLNGIR